MGIKVDYIVRAGEPKDVTATLHQEVRRRMEHVQARQPTTQGVKKSAGLVGEVSAFQSVLWLLEGVKIEGALAAPFERGKWGFDGQLEYAVRLIADLAMSSETEGVPRDDLCDAVIAACRKLRDREESVAREEAAA